MEVKLILFGCIASGKDSFYKIFNEISQQEGIKCKLAKIGGEIRQEVDNNIKLLDIPPNQARRLYVEYGENVRGIFGEDLWNHKLYNKIKNEDNVIIADGRKLNELQFWLCRGYTPVAIVADEEQRKQRVLQRDGYDQSDMFDNPTEIACKECIEEIISKDGMVIYNNGNVIDFIDEVKRLYRSLKLRSTL